MKKIAVFVIGLILTGTIVMAENYNTPFNNAPEYAVELKMLPKNLIIIGHNKDEIIIETNFEKTSEDLKPSENGRADGLKPLTGGGADNTNLGVSVQKEGNVFRIKGLSKSANKGEMKLYIPNKVRLIINGVNIGGRAKASISNLAGDIEIQTVNTEFKMEQITGPVVATVTNGNMEIIYGNEMAQEASSISIVNGFVDISAPATTKADLELNCVRGQIFTDFDVKYDDDETEALLLDIYSIEGTINGGGFPININSVQGNIYLRKKK